MDAPDILSADPHHRCHGWGRLSPSPEKPVAMNDLRRTENRAEFRHRVGRGRGEDTPVVTVSLILLILSLLLMSMF